MAESLAIFLRGHGFECSIAPDGVAALRMLSHGNFDLVLCHAGEGATGRQLVPHVRDEFPGTAVLLLDPPAGWAAEAEPVRSVVRETLARPIPYEDVLLRLRRVLAERDASAKPDPLRPELRRPRPAEALIGRSPQMKTVLKMMRKLASSPITVLITGETGTGKEVVARMLHDTCSFTCDQKFVPINCAAIPATLMESELFGHVRGAFTGATAEKKGLFEIAEGGTLFLDEIGELDLGLQAKLLRSIDRKEIVRVGGVTPIPLDVRIACATNRNLKDEIAARRFREDLYFRISVVEIGLPPLRERPEDIPDLARHFIARLDRELKRQCQGVEDAAMEALQAYAWPGNVRELQNVIERAMILREGQVIGLQDLPANIARGPSRSPRRLREALRAFEKDYIRAVLDDVGQDREEAAKRLGIGVSSLYRKLRALDLLSSGPSEGWRR
ncbi:MAG: sigma-54-dependent Fis family transcriptional regulator [Planctomycetes bacterium]|nr:sigma-54-dependent Fis family transcriptional regulator [Planctomycetota bacterium]